MTPLEPQAGPGHRRLLALVLPLFAILGSCGGGGEEAGTPWRPLARGFRASGVEEVLRAWEGEAGSFTVRTDDASGGLWVERAVPASDWTPRRQGEGYRLQRPDTPAFRASAGELYALRLEADSERGLPAREVRRVRRQDLPNEAPVEEPLFTQTRQAILLRLPAGAELPPRLTLSSFLPRGADRQGTWRIGVTDATTDGIPVWPGEEVVVADGVPPSSSLQFRLSVRPLGRPGNLTLRVSLGPRTLHEETLPFGAVDQLLARSIALPEGGASDPLRVSIEGDPALTSLVGPILRPSEIGSYGDRPWGSARPDLVVLLLDTFRADNLAAWGGDPAVAPHLNALAADSVRFLNARSTAVWTLPSHGSLFTGVYPPQHGAVDSDLTLASGLVTVAERLAEYGYRTGAVTDSGLVSERYGLDRGFSWFQETPEGGRHLTRTFQEAEAFLDADDGRPIFLFVHTYRAHAPYRLGIEEDTTADEDINARMAARVRAWREAGGEGSDGPVLAQFKDEYLQLYRDGVTGLDAALGPWLERLGERGLREDGYLIVTSDHGEEFFEHGHRYHAAPPHEEKVRVPLFFQGPGLSGDDVLLGASHIDFAPTLTALAAVPPATSWKGTPLFELDHERLLFSHHGVKEQHQFVTVTEGPKKVYAAESEALRRGEVLAAYDLAQDPVESLAKTGETAPWSVPLARRAGEAWVDLSLPLGRSQSIELDAEAENDLRGLGYVE